MKFISAPITVKITLHCEAEVSSTGSLKELVISTADEVDITNDFLENFPYTIQQIQKTFKVLYKNKSYEDDYLDKQRGLEDRVLTTDEITLIMKEYI